MKKIRGKTLKEWKEYCKSDNVPIKTMKYITCLEEYIEALTIPVVGSSDSDVIADIRNKLGNVTALMDLVRLRNTEHSDYVEKKIDEQLDKAVESINYIKQL